MRYFLVKNCKTQKTHFDEKNLLKDGAVILITPDKNFCNRSQRLDQQTTVALRHSLVLVQHWVQIPEKNIRTTFIYFYCLVDP